MVAGAPAVHHVTVLGRAGLATPPQARRVASTVIDMTARVDGSRLRGSAELQYMLGVSRQRITQLTADAAFPEPVTELRMGKVWDLADIESWAQRAGRELRRLPASWPVDTAADSPGSGSGKYRRG
jgi:predicted DNA-binding transcriptional regulator AlpA